MAKERVSQIVFVALDVLLAVDSERVKGAIARLNERNIPVIVFGDCDRAELEPIRANLGLTAPFIVENGSAIFTAVDANPFVTPLGEQDGNYYVYELGCPYVQARAGLRVLANEISHPLKGFGDFTVQQLERSLALSEGEAHRAKAREFSEPFMTPKSADLDALKQSAKAIGFDVVLKDSAASRFSFLRGHEASLTTAAKKMIEAYQAQTDKTKTLSAKGVSTQLEDLDCLALAKGMADWSSALIPTNDVEAVGLETIESLS